MNYHTRRYFISTFFIQGPKASSIRPLRRISTNQNPKNLRVVLIDGLSLAQADQIPSFKAICDQGIRFSVDVGWPSVSLPVQHSLFTGRWQTESGILFTIEKLDSPIFDSLQASISRHNKRSFAFANAHKEIVSSFPYSEIIAPETGYIPLDSFEETVTAKLNSDIEFIFIHLLDVDRAGHRFGGDSQIYREKAIHAANFTQRIYQAMDKKSALLILSDHGHLARGGHGGKEKRIRYTRACLLNYGKRTHKEISLKIIDLTEIMADIMGIEAPLHAKGRCLRKIINNYPVHKQPPSILIEKPYKKTLLYFGCSLLLALFCLCVYLFSARVFIIVFPWASLIPLACTIFILGTPSLSRSWIYPSWPFALFYFAPVAWFVLALQCYILKKFKITTTTIIVFLTISLVIPPLIFLGKCGFPFNKPPLYPFLTAWTSTVLFISLSAFIGLLGIVLSEIVDNFKRHLHDKKL